jgi:hypothetical protein
MAQSAAATPIDYIFNGTAAGTLGGQAFSGLLTLTATGDTGDVTLAGSLYRNATVTTVIDIPGVGPVTVTGPDYVFDSQSSSKIGYGVSGIPSCCDIIQFIDPAYATYDLQSAIGPLAYPTDLSIVDWMDVPTSGGLLTLTRFETNSFQAAVPEPGIGALFLGGLAGLGFLRRKRISA